MVFSLEQVAESIGGVVEGDDKLEVSLLANIEEAMEGALTFLSNPKYVDYIYSTKATAVIVSKDFKPKKKIRVALIRVDNPYKAFVGLLNLYNEYNKTSKIGVEDPVHIGESFSKGDDFYLGAFSYIGNNVKVGHGVKIFPHTYIGDNVSIGDGTVIYSGVNIYPNTVIGNSCNIDSGTVIGSEGFGFILNEEGAYDRVPQIGNVVIEDRVDIGACVTIDRSTIGSTLIGKGVKLDNQIHIAHNVAIGDHTAMAAQTGIAGSVKIGKYCRIGGQAGIAGHLTIADKVSIQAQSGVTKSQKEGVYIQGTPAFEYKKFNKSYVYFKKLPDLLEKLYKK